MQAVPDGSREAGRFQQLPGQLGPSQRERQPDVDLPGGTAAPPLSQTELGARWSTVVQSVSREVGTNPGFLSVRCACRVYILIYETQAIIKPARWDC